MKASNWLTKINQFFEWTAPRVDPEFMKKITDDILAKRLESRRLTGFSREEEDIAQVDVQEEIRKANERNAIDQAKRESLNQTKQ